MKILAIDASTKSSGIAIFEDKTLLGYSTIKASSADLITRIHKMVDTIDALVEQGQIDQIVMEEVIPDPNKNKNTFKALSWLQAAIMIMLHDKHPMVTVELIYPGTWRSQCGIQTGRGIRRESLKEADISKAKEVFCINSLNDDEADACLLGGVFVGIFENPKKEKDYSAALEW